jgi:hypothetical protein
MITLKSRQFARASWERSPTLGRFDDFDAFLYIFGALVSDSTLTVDWLKLKVSVA